MAKLIGGEGLGGNRRSAFKHGLVVSSWRGIPVIKLKKTGRRKTISRKQAAAMDTFSELANAAKRITPAEYETAVQMTKDSQYLWRDIYYMALTGRLWFWLEPGGGKWISMAARTTMSDALDALGSQFASILIRGTEFWEILPPGEPGQVLTTLGPDAAPVWGPGGGGGAPAAVVLRIATAAGASSTWPKIAPWGEALQQDWAAWDISQPTIITLPDVAGKVRFSVSTRFTTTATASTFLTQIAQASDSATVFQSNQSMYTRVSGSFGEARYTMQGVWEQSVPGLEVVVKASATGTPNVGWDTDSFLQVEFQPD